MHFAFLRATFFDNLAHISLLKPSLKTGTQSFTYEKDKNGQQLLFSGFLAQSRWEREEGRKKESSWRESANRDNLCNVCVCLCVYVCVTVHLSLSLSLSLSLNCCQVKWVVGLLLGQFQSPLFDVIKRTLVTSNETGGKKFTTCFCLFAFIYISSGNLMMLPMMQEAS